MYALHARSCMFRADWHAQPVISRKISASELRRKFIKRALLVGILVILLLLVFLFLFIYSHAHSTRVLSSDITYTFRDTHTTNSAVSTRNASVTRSPSYLLDGILGPPVLCWLLKDRSASHIGWATAHHQLQILLDTLLHLFCVREF